MTREASGARAMAAGLAAALLLSACTGSLFRSREPPRSVYLLSVAPARVRIAPDLTVLRPRVRPGLDSDRIAVLYPDRRLDHFAGARWSGPLDEMLEDLELRAFGAAGCNAHADDAAFGGGDAIEVYVADFQAEYPPAGGPPTAHVRLVARIGAAGERRLLGEAEADVRRPAAQDRLSSIVEAFNQAVDAALARIAAEAARTLSPR